MTSSDSNEQQHIDNHTTSNTTPAIILRIITIKHNLLISPHAALALLLLLVCTIITSIKLLTSMVSITI